MQIIVDDLLTNYDSAGSGPVVLLLHGWGDEGTTFRHLAEALSKTYRVVWLDLPGFGKTQPPKQTWNLDDYAAFLASFLNKLEIGPLYALIGHSNGGALAIRGLAAGGLQANKLVLLAASGIRNTQKVRRLLLKSIAKTGKVATFWLPQRHKRKLQKKLYGVAGSDMLVAPHLQETFKRTVRQDVQADAVKLKLPTLLLYGESDRATPPEYGELFQNLIDGSRLIIIEDAEHFVHQDQPERVGREVQEFLA